jgi:hypothetical protein
MNQPKSWNSATFSRTDPFFIALLAMTTGILSASRGYEIDPQLSYLVGLRHLAGQTLYRDFYVPHGPVAGWIFAGFLRLLPTGGTALITASLGLNMAAALGAWGIVWRVTQSSRHALYAGLLTASWYTTIFGTYYHDHLAYLFASAAFGLIAAPTGRRLFFAGLLLALSFHTKQTVGIVALVAYVGIILIRPPSTLSRFNQIRYLTLALVVTHTGIFLWLAGTTDITGYLKYSVWYPYRYVAVAHSDKNPLRIFEVLAFPYLINPWEMLRHRGLGQILFYPVVLIGYVGMLVLIRNQTDRLRSPALAALAFFLVSSLWCSAMLGRLYAHVFLGMGIAIAILLFLGRKKRPLELFVVASFCALGLVFTWHLHGRFFHEDPYYAKTDLYPAKIELTPTNSDNHAVIDYLRAHPQKTAFLGQATTLAVLALRMAPTHSPVCYNNLTVPHPPDLRRAWQLDFIQEIESRHTELIVADVMATLRLYPVLTEYLKTHYQNVLYAGALQILQRKIPASRLSRRIDLGIAKEIPKRES